MLISSREQPTRGGPLAWGLGEVLIISRGQPTRGGSLAWGLGEVLTNPHCKNYHE